MFCTKILQPTLPFERHWYRQTGHFATGRYLLMISSSNHPLSNCSKSFLYHLTHNHSHTTHESFDLRGLIPHGNLQQQRVQSGQRHAWPARDSGMRSATERPKDIDDPVPTGHTPGTKWTITLQFIWIRSLHFIKGQISETEIRQVIRAW